MIAFVTLFLSLVAGPQEIEVAVGPEVARVELLLDGRNISTLTAAPWKLRHDFGLELAPRELLAIAYDADDKETGRARQLLNVPHPRAGASLIVAASGDGLEARLRFKSVEGNAPESFEVVLDGEPLPVADPGEIPLPAVDPEIVHLLTAEGHYADGTDVRTWTTFGGTFGERSEAQVTAVPLTLEPGTDEISVADLGGRISAGGALLRVLAVEGGSVEVLMVRAADTREALLRLGLGENARSNDEPVVDPLRTMPRFLARRDRFNVLATWNADGGQTAEANLFPLLISDRRLLQAGLPTILTRGFAPVPEGARHRLADAVAAAGRNVAGEHRPRAVILVIGGRTKDRSVYSPAQVRRYLHMLRVPLTVWHIPTRRGQRPPAEWGETVDISTPIRLREALTGLRASLDRQRIVWVAGSHLPQAIELSLTEKRFRLAP